MIKNVRIAYSLLSPSLFWLLIFLIAPLGMIGIISFTTNTGFGGILYKFSIDAYKLSFSSLYAEVIWKSFLWTGIVHLYLFFFLIFFFIFLFVLVFCKIN